MTEPAVNATRTAAMRPHMSAARSCFASNQATNVGTTSVAAVMAHSPQASRHQGPAAGDGGTPTAAAACARNPMTMLDVFMPVLVGLGVMAARPAAARQPWS
jgi:hypothetical protein